MSQIHHRLFVYGSLAPGRTNEHLLQPLRGTWQKARVKGKLFDGGWGSALGYPGLKLEYDEVVNGWLFTSQYLPQHWQQLDEFEGESYERTAIEVTLEDESQVEAYTYVLV